MDSTQTQERQTEYYTVLSPNCKLIIAVSRKRDKQILDVYYHG